MAGQQRTSSGLIDAHSHLRSTALVDHGVPGSTLEESLLRMNAMTAVDIEDDVFVATARMLEAGITGVQAMYHSFAPPEEYLEGLSRVIAGVRRSGIRALIILGITDQAEFLPPWSRRSITLPGFVHQHRGMTAEQFGGVVDAAIAAHPEIAIGVGPVGPQWCSEGLLRMVAEIAASGLRIHTHCVESQVQRTWDYPDPISRLERAGLVGPHTSLAHAVWASAEEVSRLVDTGTHLVTCPHSNRLLGAGEAPVSMWQESGASIALGLDSAESLPDPLGVARMVFPADPWQVLVSGGQAATGLPTDEDEVVFIDDQSGRVDRVLVGGRELVTQGAHTHRDSVADAWDRIVSTMSADATERGKRQSQLDEIMADYLDALTPAP